MARTFLVDADIRDGRRFVDALLAAGVPIAVAVWFRMAETGRYKLHVATPDVQAHGRLNMYHFFTSVLRALDLEDLALTAPVAANTTTDAIGGVADQLRVEHGAARLGPLLLDGLEIEDGIVYEARPRTEVAPSPTPPVFDPARLSAAATG